MEGNPNKTLFLPFIGDRPGVSRSPWGWVIRRKGKLSLESVYSLMWVPWGSQKLNSAPPRPGTSQEWPNHWVMETPIGRWYSGTARISNISIVVYSKRSLWDALRTTPCPRLSSPHTHMVANLKIRRGRYLGQGQH